MLWYVGNTLLPSRPVAVINRDCVDDQLPFSWFEQTHKNIAQRGFSTAGRAHDADPITLVDLQVDILEHPMATLSITEPDAIKLNLLMERLGLDLISIRHGIPGQLQQVEHIGKHLLVADKVRPGTIDLLLQRQQALRAQRPRAQNGQCGYQPTRTLAQYECQTDDQNDTQRLDEVTWKLVENGVLCLSLSQALVGFCK